MQLANIYLNTEIFLSLVLQAVVKHTWPVPLAWRLVSSISIPSMSDSLICLLIWRQHGQMVTTKKSWRSMPIQLFWSWMSGFYWNQRIQNKGTSSNCFIGDVRNLQRFSVPSMHSRNGMSSSTVVTVLWQMQSLTVFAHDSYRINITSIDVEHDRLMREVYDLDKELRE